MLKRNTILLLAGTAALLSACGPSGYRGLESARQPVVQRADYVFDAAMNGSYLAPGEQARVAGWLASLRIGYGDRIYVDAPYGGVREQIAVEVSRYGLMLSDPAPVTAGAIEPGMARVIVSRMRASVPGCPDWSVAAQPEFAGATTSNYGCAVNGNLAAMVARPEDLVRGQPGAETADPATSYKAIDTLRKAPTSGAGGLKQEATGGGGK